MDIHLPRGLPARQTRFVCLLAARPSLTRADYQRLLRVSYATAKRDLADLVAAGLVLPLGRTRTRRYALSPLALRPALVPRDASDQRLISDGSTDANPAQVRITIDLISVSHRQP